MTTLNIVYNDETHCFIGLPSSFRPQHSFPNCIFIAELRWISVGSDPTILTPLTSFVCVDAFPSTKATLEIGRAFAERLGLGRFQKISVVGLVEVPYLQSKGDESQIFLDCKNPEEAAILSLHYKTFQDLLTTQIKCVYHGLHFPFYLSDHISVIISVSLKPITDKFCILYPDTKVFLSVEKQNKESKKEETADKEIFLHHSHFQSILTTLSSPCPPNILLLGPRECGKTFFLKRVYAHFRENCTDFHTIFCKLSQHSPASVFEALYYDKIRPLHRTGVRILLLLDNLPYLSHHSSNRDCNNLLLLKLLTRPKHYSVVATALDLEHKALSPALFSEIVTLTYPSSTDREHIVNTLCAQHHLDPSQVGPVSNYPISKIIAKISALALGSFPFSITNDPNEKVMISFSDIIGHDSIIELLQKHFLWPLKYPSLYSSAPLPLHKGCLLHGPPGCGKTALALACANEGSFHLFHIKGPELLSKYVGQSEQLLRDLFFEARQNAPSIIFFDHVESLFPKRGTDNTKTTDRIVNQVLSLLDGVEDFAGSPEHPVYIFCATNRSDLVDPALLRPGRIGLRLRVDPPTHYLPFLLKLGKEYGFPIQTTIWEAVNATLLGEPWTPADIQGLFHSVSLRVQKNPLGDDEHEWFNAFFSEIITTKPLISLRNCHNNKNNQTLKPQILC